MQPEKHEEALDEVERTLREALGDPAGILRHQRRIALMTSLGAQQLIELHLHRLHVIKPGAQLKHEWFKLDQRNLEYKLAPLLTKPGADIPKLAEALSLAFRIETGRNDLVYGAPIASDRVLRERIDAFLELKRVLEG